MTTAAMPHPPQSAAAAPRHQPRQMQEVQAPEMFQFTKEKPAIEGVYLGSTRVTVTDKKTGQGKETLQYMLQDLDGRRFTFLATYDLSRKIQPAHVGHWMYVMYEGEDLEIKTQGSPMRKFRVAVGRDKEPGFGAGSPITDEDIPF